MNIRIVPPKCPFMRHVLFFSKIAPFRFTLIGPAQFRKPQFKLKIYLERNGNRKQCTAGAPSGATRLEYETITQVLVRAHRHTETGTPQVAVVMRRAIVQQQVEANFEKFSFPKSC